MELSHDELIDRVTARTRGTAGDPLSRDEVEQVVTATLLELHGPPGDHEKGEDDGEQGPDSRGP